MLGKSPLLSLFEIAGHMHTFAVGSGLARIHQPGSWSLGEVVFGADQRIWYVRSEASRPRLGELLREKFPARESAIEAAAEQARTGGVRLGLALVDAGSFSVEEIVRVLRIQAALGLIEVAARCEPEQIDVAWTPLFDGGDRLPAPTLIETFLAAAHRVTMGTSMGEEAERCRKLRRAGFAGVIFSDAYGDGLMLPVRHFGPIQTALPDVFRLHDLANRQAEAEQEVIAIECATGPPSSPSPASSIQASAARTILLARKGSMVIAMVPVKTQQGLTTTLDPGEMALAKAKAALDAL